jgi:SAM-dependent methyltransferase
MAQAYGADLAYTHDAGFGHFARSAAPVLLEALGPPGPDPGLVIELGCGSGIMAAEVAAAGYPILGYDISAAMVALARKRVPQGRFRRQSLWSAELPSCRAVASIGECFNYLFDTANTSEALAQLFRRVHQALVPGGVFLFDVAEPGRIPEGRRQQYRLADDWAVLVDVEEDRGQRVLTRRIATFRRVGKHYRRDYEVHRLRLLPGAELAQELRDIGFRVRMLRGYGAFRFPPGYVGLLARKPTSP